MYYFDHRLLKDICSCLQDPDVAEDMTDPKTSTEAISRRRVRNEICISLKRSSIIRNVYVAKNVAEIFLVVLFLVINITYVLEPTPEHARCRVPLHKFPMVHKDLDEEGAMHFQCRGKKQSFFELILWVQVIINPTTLLYK